MPTPPDRPSRLTLTSLRLGSLRGADETRLDQTNRGKARFAPADLVTTFPAPHDAAETTPRATASKGTPWARPAAITPRPARATQTPATWRKLGRSPSATTANGIVNRG